MDEQVRKFNIKLNELISVIESDLPTDKSITSMVEDVKRKIKCVLTIDRTFIIKEAKQELMNYKDYIAEGRIEDLIYSNLDNEISTQAAKYDVAVDKKSMDMIIDIIRCIWEKYDDEQKAYIKKSLKRLLSYCVKFHKMC